MTNKSTAIRNKNLVLQVKHWELKSMIDNKIKMWKEKNSWEENSFAQKKKNVADNKIIHT